MSFYWLFRKLISYQHDQTYRDVIVPHMQMAIEDMQALSIYGDLASMALPSDHTHVSYEWYALSRVNDVLLMNFQPEVAGFDWRKDAYIKAYPPVSLNEYQVFMSELGMREVESRPFHPFYHEIVAVEQTEDPDAPPMIVQTLWPCLMYGALLFSRGGVVIRAGARHIVKAIAEQSIMYFTYARKYRRTDDQSHGWGHNSQWSTNFRRDYESDEAYHYHIEREEDGTLALNDLALVGDTSIEGRHGQILLTRETRRELLRHRCFVSTDFQGEYLADPYADYLIEPKP
jgi:hypothetical protein